MQVLPVETPTGLKKRRRGPPLSPCELSLGPLDLARLDLARLDLARLKLAHP
jgi:hypothetical protein